MYAKLTQDKKIELGQVIKSIRKSINLTQEAVSQIINVPTQYIGSLERGGVDVVRENVKGRMCPWASAITICKFMLSYATETQKETIISLVGSDNIGVKIVSNEKMKVLLEFLRENADKMDDKFINSMSTAVVTSVKSNVLKNAELSPKSTPNPLYSPSSNCDWGVSGRGRYSHPFNKQCIDQRQDNLTCLLNT